MKKLVTIIKPNGKRLVTSIDENFVLKEGDKFECDECVEVPEVKEDAQAESVIKKAVKKVKKATKKK